MEARADEDLFAQPSPTSTFFSDHSHDNEDVDGTRLKKKGGSSLDDDDITAPRKSDKDNAALSVLDEHQVAEDGQGKSEVGGVIKGPKEKEALSALGMEKTPTPTPTLVAPTPSPTPDDL
jgi:hypothetical protein